ncbi:MAG TPA: glycosyltransferase family 87 protein [Bradyrhizobium sp.]|uniref:glycosyltransferase family 87 protein n=1 Tax=Bradyrhizobium sp. TaxID=376 RepID=UPI002D806151|nr:glycosyltransferase family 87 protein [Bradyrhizobium sp.]HET7888530.1 glycosyltransferase family 87 protein [Bradyrhizobium sp.]
MAHFWQRLRSGDWLTAARARAYSLILLCLCIAATVGWIVLSDGLIDHNGKPIGTDFSSFYAAGSLALEGHAANAYIPALHYAREQSLFGEATPYYSWNYPPVFLLIAAPLALLPYPLALAVFQASGFLLYLSVIATILAPVRPRNPVIARNWLPVAAAYPAVFINLGHGQNGFLTAGLLGAALAALERPVLSGLCIGLLSYKPQFALVIPIALLAAGCWGVIVSAALTVVTLIAASCFAFGIDSWTAFIGSTGTSRKVLLEQGAAGFEKLQSAFAAVRLWGGSVPLAYAVQSVVSALAVLATAWAWRASNDRALKAALLVCATALTSPHLLDYDLVLLAPALAFLTLAIYEDGARDFDKTLLALIWIMPLLTRSVAGLTSIPLGLLATLALFALVLRRLYRQRDHVASEADSTFAYP